jgi:deferrochelatase/peroxidase EfeB
MGAIACESPRISARMTLDFAIVTMTDSTDRLEQVERNLSLISDRLTAFQEVMNATATSNQAQMEVVNGALARTTVIVERLGTQTASRLQQHDLELDDHDVRVERLERDHVEHSDRMGKLDALLTVMQEDRQTTLQILQMMTARFAGEPPVGES